MKIKTSSLMTSCNSQTPSTHSLEGRMFLTSLLVTLWADFFRQSFLSSPPINSPACRFSHHSLACMMRKSSRECYRWRRFSIESALTSLLESDPQESKYRTGRSTLIRTRSFLVLKDVHTMLSSWTKFLRKPEMT